MEEVTAKRDAIVIDVAPDHHHATPVLPAERATSIPIQAVAITESENAKIDTRVAIGEMVDANGIGTVVLRAAMLGGMMMRGRPGEIAISSTSDGAAEVAGAKIEDEMEGSEVVLLKSANGVPAHHPRRRSRLPI